MFHIFLDSILHKIFIRQVSKHYSFVELYCLIAIYDDDLEIDCRLSLFFPSMVEYSTISIKWHILDNWTIGDLHMRAMSILIGHFFFHLQRCLETRLFASLHV